MYIATSFALCMYIYITYNFLAYRVPEKVALCLNSNFILNDALDCPYFCQCEPLSNLELQSLGPSGLFCFPFPYLFIFYVMKSYLFYYFTYIWFFFFSPPYSITSWIDGYYNHLSFPWLLQIFYFDHFLHSTYLTSDMPDYIALDSISSCPKFFF